MSFILRAQDRYDELMEAAPALERGFRERAWDAYRKLGVPERGSEAWKYSSPAFVTKRDWLPSAPDVQVPDFVREITADWTSTFDFIFIVNGRKIETPRPYSAPHGARAGSYERDFNFNFDDGLISAAVALSKGGFELELLESPPRPIMIVHAHEGEGQWTSACNHIRLAAGVRAELVEVFASSTASYLRTDITRVDVERGARLDWVRLQTEGAQASFFADVQAHLAESAQVEVAQLNLTGEWSRNSLKFDIRGEGAEAHINGVTFGAGQSHVDQRVQVSHHVGHTVSSQLFKGILKDRARGVLNGKIYIGPKAQKVASSQLNHNLLLSPTAEADTKPELEIYADDVKANHGATVGRMDGEKLFYLLSRGLPLHESRQMLARAFVDEVLMKIASRSSRQFIQSRIESLLPDFLEAR